MTICHMRFVCWVTKATHASHSLRLLFFVLFIKFVSASTDIRFIQGGNNGTLEKVHNEELHDLYFVPNIIRVMELISLLAFDGMNCKACCN
jgi:hypothetical protein